MTVTNLQARALLERRLAQLIMLGDPFSADDLTDGGRIMLDPSGEANAGQNGVGAMVNAAARDGRIVFTGRTVKSSAPRRKGGLIRVWAGTYVGRNWARSVIELLPPTAVQ